MNSASTPRFKYGNPDVSVGSRGLCASVESSPCERRAKLLMDGWAGVMEEGNAKGKGGIVRAGAVI